MPRGRPRKNRTAEQAVKERREQVRRNVQAFRERNRLRKEQKATQDSEESAQDGAGDLSKDISIADWSADPISVSDDAYHGAPAISVKPSSGVTSPADIAQAIALWTVLPPEISYANLSRQQLVSYCISLFDDSSPTFIGKTGPHWCQTFPGIINQDATLDLSVQVICLAHLGHVARSRWLLEAASATYSRALRSLSRQIPTNTNGPDLSEDVFMAIMALAGYELLRSQDQTLRLNGNSSTDHGWLIHQRAASHYVRKLSDARGGLLPNNQAMFHYLESFCVFDALGTRKPSYFSASEAWAQSLARWGGGVYGPLLGLLTAVPGVLEGHDQLLDMERGAVEVFKERSELLGECARLEDRFLEWRERSFGCLDEERVASSGADGASETGVSSLFVVRVHLLYWTGLILLLDTITSLFRSMHSSGSAVVPGFLDEEVMLKELVARSNRYAMYIRRAASFCLRPEYGVVGKTLLLLPLWVATEHFEGVGKGAEVATWEWSLDGLGGRDMKFGVLVHEEV